jgi:hypothetical protein
MFESTFCHSEPELMAMFKVGNVQIKYSPTLSKGLALSTLKIWDI